MIFTILLLCYMISLHAINYVGIVAAHELMLMQQQH